MAEDLRAALEAAGERGPFVWAGASFGGLIAQILAHEHPEETAGVVLVDSLHPDLDREIPRVIGREAAAQRERDLASTAEGLTYDDLLRSDEEARSAAGLGGRPRRRAGRGGGGQRRAVSSVYIVRQCLRPRRRPGRSIPFPSRT